MKIFFTLLLSVATITSFATAFARGEGDFDRSGYGGYDHGGGYENHGYDNPGVENHGYGAYNNPGVNRAVDNREVNNAVNDAAAAGGGGGNYYTPQVGPAPQVNIYVPQTAPQAK